MSRYVIPCLAALIALTVFISQPAHADYSPPPLDDLIAGSDLAVLGKIVALDKTHYTLEIENTLGRSDLDPDAGKRVTIKRYQDWTCSHRWAPYAVGQRLIVFADRAKDPALPYTYVTRSAGSEGEVPIIDGDAYVIGYPALKTLGERRAFKKLGGQTATRVELTAFHQGVLEIRSKYEVHRPLNKAGYRHITKIVTHTLAYSDGANPLLRLVGGLLEARPEAQTTQ